METGIVSSPGYEASGSTTCVIQPSLLLSIRSISGRLKKICAEIIAGPHKGITLRVLLQIHAICSRKLYTIYRMGSGRILDPCWNKNAQPWDNQLTKWYN